MYRTVRIEASRSNMLQMLHVVGKLRASVTIEQARAELETTRARAAVANPEYPGNRMALRLVPLSQKLSGEGRRALSVLLSAVVLVLLIAYAVMASLLYDVRPTDLPTFASAAIGLAFTASLVPALRAARIDPSETLR